MSIRRSIAAAVFVAAVSAPTVLGTTQAMADTTPTPTPGTSQPDAPAPAEPAPANPAPAEPAPAADPAPANPAPVDPSAGEAAARARLEQLLVEPNHYKYFHDEIVRVLAGPASGWQPFLDKALHTVIMDDKMIRVTQLMSVSEYRSPIWQAAQDTLTAHTEAAVDHFLQVAWPAAASDNRVRVSQLLEDRTLGRLAREGAEKAIDGTDMEVAAFLQKLPELRLSDDRVRIAQIIATGGPEVRKAARAALEDGSPEAIRAFLEHGWDAAKAVDAAAEQANQNNQGNQGNQGGSTVTPVADTTPTTTAPQSTGTTGTTGTPTATATATGTQLATTGTDAPLGTLAVGGATALLLGAGTLVAARRRQQQD
ncbi:ALF repeat-containing protein [Kitasatospora sp. NPDC088134]|uniref:ALF repeat-containing protein n=1 Tax=Kitasatospora sp. NPDC088134 TaxID=3364071 RepID=UPI003819830D